jgi:Tol biopolymer transport system component
MVLRMATLEEALPTLGQMSVFLDSWPSGQVPYLFGESFTRYLVETYGREKVAEISLAYSGRWFPFLVGSTAERTIGRPYTEIEAEWKQGLRERYVAVAGGIEAAGLTPTVPLTSRGFVATGPVFAPDGSGMAYAVAAGDEYPGIYLRTADGQQERKLVENVFPASASGTAIAWHPDGSRLFYTRLEIARNTNAYNDIYSFDLRSGVEQRITKGLRARDPHISTDGTWLLFVMTRAGMTRLAMVNLEPASGRSFTEADVLPITPWSADQYETPRWSPDGSRIAVGAVRPGGYRDILLLDSTGTVVREVTHDRAVDCGPAWSPDGRYLYFSSDRTGVFNVYAYEMATHTLSQVTNVLGGAFAPAVSPDGATLAIASYSSRGYDIHTLAVDPAAWQPAQPFEDTLPASAAPIEPVEGESRPYSPYSTIYPRFWLPWFGYSHESGVLGGAFTLGQDVIQRHQYIATLLYGPKNGRTWYGIDYFYDRFFPTIHLSASDRDETYSDFFADLQGMDDYVERDRSLGAAIIVPLLRFSRQHALTVGYRRKELSRLSDIPPWPGYAGPLPAEGRLASARAVYDFNSSRRYAFSISPEDGRTLQLGAERFDRSLGSDHEFTKYSADWYEYLGLPAKHHTLLLHAFGGTSTGDAPPQGAYQLGGDDPGDITLTLVDRTVSLRGYPVNSLRGSRAAFAGLEYRFPLTNLEAGYGTTPFFYRRLHGALFFEAGNAWDGAYRSADLRRAVGAEARLDMTFAYFLPITIRFVIARGLDEYGESQAYLGLWVPMEI